MTACTYKTVRSTDCQRARHLRQVIERRRAVVPRQIAVLNRHGAYDGGRAKVDGSEQWRRKGYAGDKRYREVVVEACGEQNRAKRA